MTDLERIQETLDILSSGIAAGFGRINEQLDRVDQRFEGVNERLDGVDQRLKGLDQRLDGVDRRFDGIDQRLERVDQRLDHIEANIATKMELARTRIILEQGQSLLLKVVRGHTDQLGALLPAVSELNRRVGSLETAVKENAGAH